MSPGERGIEGTRSQRKEKGLGSSAEVERLAWNKNKNSSFSEPRAKNTGIS